MNFINSVIGYPLGWIMWACYQLISNYGVALILFTVITKLLLVPTAIKQQKSTVRLKMIQPKVNELQKKYANNKNKLNEELTALYARENYNPAAGCLPMLIQLPILFGLIDVIYKPLTHILRLPADVITAASDILTAAGTAANGMASHSQQISIIGAVKNNPALFADLGNDVVNKIVALDLDFLGINLTVQPTLGFNLLMLIPILSGATSMLLSVVSMKNTGMGDNAATAATGKSMLYMMPLLSLWFTMQVPTGVGFYWIISNILMLVQTMLLHKYFNPAEMVEKYEAEEAERRERERQQKIEAKRLAKENEGSAAAAALSQKEINRQKLAAARKRDAEKYGDRYEEVTDDDLK